MAAPNDMVEMLATESVSSTQTPIHGYSFEGEIAATVNIADLKPILMANMAGVSEEVQVSTQLSLSHQDDLNLSEGMLRSHLMASKPCTPGTRRQVTSEIYPDSETGVTYEIVRGGTTRGRDKLIDSLGFTYNMKQGRGNKNLTYWWCAIRNSHLRCPASVVQRNSTFIRGKRKHEHLVGQSTPKPHSHSSVKRAPVGRPVGSSRFTMKADRKVPSTPNYKIIKEGSKAGKDLLRDRFGYTYTQKKVSADGHKTTWRCSVRNNMCACYAIVIQAGNVFEPGKTQHIHLPGQNRKLGEQDVLPKMAVLNADYDDDDDDDYAEEYIGAAGDASSQTYHSYNKSASSMYTGFGATPVKKVSREQRLFAKESKRKDHTTFLGPSCTINLTKCDDSGCNCKMVHCPFCDQSHFIPSKAGKVQDHLEMTHFAHGVQYDDLMIVKCFQDCNLERNFGHYHCVFCCQQILKRNSYARHMLRHMRKLGIPDRLLVLPDSKFPDVINAYGYEIPICRKVSCQSSRDKHYHCPQCQQLCKERSLTVNHLWRCLQKKSEVVEPGSDDEEMLNTIDDSQLNLHFSHIKYFKDLPLEKCSHPSCCNQMYHCRLCPPGLFRPSYRQHLIAHYMTHWKQRVPYKGYALLKCFQTCEGIDRRYFKTKFHFHCPICCKIILTKGSFEEHIRGCHMFKFGENLIDENLEELDSIMVEDVSLVQELAPIHDNVEYMEDKLTAQAIALEERKLSNKWSRVSLSQKRVPQYGGKFRGAGSKQSEVNKLVKTIKQEITNALEQEELNYLVEGNNTADVTDNIFGINIADDEIFDLGSVIFSEKFIDALKGATVVNSVLGKVSGLTNTKLSQEGGRYLLSGKLEDLLHVKTLLMKAISGLDESEEEELEEESEEDVKPTRKLTKKRGGRKTRTTTEESEDETPKVTSSKTLHKDKGGKGTGKKRKQFIEPPKKGRGRPKRNADSFPYSEIKEIIEASKQTDEGGKKGRGKPSKKLPGSKSPHKTGSERSSKRKTPITPSRYSTRGVKRDYLQMSSGNSRVVVKQEVVSESESSEDEQLLQVTEEGLKRINKQRGRRTRSDTQDEEQEEEDEEEAVKNKGKKNDKASYLDDSEQEELDQMSSENEDDDDTDGIDKMKDDEDVLDSPNRKIIVVSSNKSAQKITDSTVQQLKTTNVSTSVPIISKVGIRQMSCGKKKVKNDCREFEKMVELGNEDNPKCSLCDSFVAMSFSDMTKHLKTYHHVDEPPRCDICELDLDTFHSLTAHIEKKHGPKNVPSFKCDFADCSTKLFSTLASLRSHVSSVHKSAGKVPNSKKHACDQCSYATKSVEDIYEHKKIAHSENITCKPCDKTFMTYQSLKSHNDLKHAETLPRDCFICSKKFSNQAYLQRHLKLHNSSAACKICHKVIATRSSLAAHMETHKPEEDRNYKHICSYCGKKFFLKNNFEDHLNKHTGNRPYKCDLCDKRFGFRSMLKRHKTFVHSSDRPFKCGFCMKGFKYMNLLKNHVTVHTNQSKHVCPNCTKSFSTASTLRFHRQKCRHITEMALATIRPGESLLIKTDSVLASVSGQSIETESGGVPPVGEQVVETSKEVADVDLNVPNAVSNEEGFAAVGDVGESSETEIAVFACSECRATFRAFKDAELHILTAHSQIQTI